MFSENWHDLQWLYNALWNVDLKINISKTKVAVPGSEYGVNDHNFHRISQKAIE